MVTEEHMERALEDYENLLSVHDNPERPSDVWTVLSGRLGMSPRAVRRLRDFLNNLPDDERGGFTAGLLCGGLILAEAAPADVIPFPTAPDAPPEDLAA